MVSTAFSQDRYWVAEPYYHTNFTSTAGWTLAEDNGTGSWDVSANGATVQVDNAGGGFAVRLISDDMGPESFGTVVLRVLSLTAGQRFSVEAVEYNNGNQAVDEHTLISNGNAPGVFIFSMEAITWGAETDYIRFVILADNTSSLQGSMELGYFNYSVSSTDTDWNNANNWSTTSGGTGGASVPGASNTAIFDGASGSSNLCLLTGPVSVAGLVLDGFTGTIDLRGNDLTIDGVSEFTTGTIMSSGSAASLAFNSTDAPVFGGTNILCGMSSSGELTSFQPASSSELTGNVAITAQSVVLNDITFQGDASFTITGAGNITSTGTTTFNGDVTVNGPSTVTFGAGTITFTGNASQTIDGTAALEFTNIVLNKSGGSITLNSPVTVTSSLTFTSGVLNSSTTDYVSFADGATVSGASNTSHVDGPVRKSGDDDFTFPTGDNGVYRPIAITSVGSSTEFEAEFSKQLQAFGTAVESGIVAVSGCEYWELNRVSGSGTPMVTLSWNSPDCSGTYITDPTQLVVAHWDGATWEDFGNGGFTGNATSGTIATSAAVTNFSPFALASTSEVNPLPIVLTDFYARTSGSTVELYWTTASELNNDHFTIERSGNGIDYESIGKIKGAGTSLQRQSYSFTDEAPRGGLSYYRLKQTDFDGKETTHKVVSVTRPGEPFLVFPNPAHHEEVFLSQKSHVKVTNALNQVLIESAAVESFDASMLQPGLYIVRNHKGEFAKLVIE